MHRSIGAMTGTGHASQEGARLKLKMKCDVREGSNDEAPGWFFDAGAMICTVDIVVVHTSKM